MGTFVSVSGWIRLSHSQRTAVEAVIARHPHELYSGGWAFPGKPFNWVLQVFYGGDLRLGYEGWLREQVAEIAALPPIDDDGDRPTGLFVLFAEEEDNPRTWQIRDGGLREQSAPELAWIDE